MGFILAASGSAIGLGNIVFFPANAYRYGGGAFYVPYFIALFVIGLPVMMTEFGLGGLTKKSFPLAMRQAGGRFGEFVGWFAILNASFIAMYYLTILSWVVGMGLQGMAQPVGEAFDGTTHVPWLGGAGGELDNPMGTFFKMVSTWLPAFAVLGVWLLNFLFVSRGTQTIEKVVKVFVPLMWLAMLALIVRGLTLPGGFDGVKTLFTPEVAVLVPDFSDEQSTLQSIGVWQGAMAQMFFTLSLGFGVMTAYSSYLPDRSDHAHNAITTSLLNCGFEWVAGVAIFAMLFAFSIQPSASSLAMMFFVVPRGIAELPVGAQVFAVGFFALLLVAGLTSSISLMEAIVSSAQDKFRASRTKTLLICAVIGISGSLAFALPKVIDHGLAGGGTIGLTLVDLIDHWAFQYGLLLVGLFECLLIGWGIGSERIRHFINERSRFRIGVWFDVLIRFVIPGLLIGVIGFNLYAGEYRGGLYGSAMRDYTAEGGFWEGLLPMLPYLALGVWLVGCVAGAVLLTSLRGVDTIVATGDTSFEPDEKAGPVYDEEGTR